MLSRASKFVFPVGCTMAYFPNAVFAASNPSRIYDEPSKESCPPSSSVKECKDTELERLVMKCRQELGPFNKEVSKYTDNMKSALISAYGSLKDNLCYLRTRAPDEVKIGTIVTGGLLGMMFGFRRGRTRKLLFGSLGAAGASYLVYPKETVYYITNGSCIAQTYISIAYNFVTGGVKDRCPPGQIKSTSPKE